MPRKRSPPATRTNPNPWRARPVPHWSGVLAPVIANAFQDLRISVALYTKEEGVPEEWYPIHIAPSVTTFEFAGGTVSRRYPYNYRMFAQVRRKRATVLGTHAGFHDLFVPVGDDGELWGILAVGPIALSRPSSADLHERWQALSGARGRLTDPSFRDYVSSSLSTLTLEGPHYHAFERLMVCFANLVGGQGDPGALADEAAALRIRLIETRFAERMWEATRAMLDERTSRAWPHHSHATLALLAMKQVPRHVAVGLLLGRNDDVDPVDDLLRRDAFQRACVVLARKRGGFAFERMGDHGVALLLDHTGSESSARARLVESANQLAALARRFGLRMHTGIGPVGDSTLLPERYDAALAAAERALAEGKAMVHADRRPERGAREIRKLRRDLGKSAGSHPSLLSPRFDRYIEAALVHCRYRYEQVRAELAAGIERLAEPLLATGALDEKSFEEMCAAMDDPSESAPTVAALIARYKLLVFDLEKVLEQPSVAGRDRGIRRAIAFVREHASEPLGLAQVARVAGFAPGYFSKLFKRDEGVTFERYLRALRLERARQMLHATGLSVERVRQLAGFRTRSYFNRVFRQSFGTTPIAYRERANPPRKL